MNRATSNPAGIYVHWPFCERKCPYCDFYSLGRDAADFNRSGAYCRALLDEIATTAERLGLDAPPAADTIYFGGGTPSLMRPDELSAILARLNEVFRLLPNLEMTLEINPTTAESAALDRFIAAGVNRLSVGCQSFNDRILRELGRVHDAATTRRALERMAAFGIPISLDLIFGAPTQTLAEFREDLETALGFDPSHISAYGMTIHEGTPFARRLAEGALALPDDDEQAAMFEHLMDRLAAAGYGHYEISNWARPGMASRHNQKYWRRCDVFGFGVAAHTIHGGRRLATPADLAQYLDPARRRVARPLDPPAGERARCGEILMLALRRVGGVPWDEIADWMGRDPRALYRDELARLAAQGLIAIDAAALRLTRRGILVADSVMEVFF